MKRAGVIGHPLGHSLSPTIFQVAFEATGVEAAYEAWDTAPEDLEGRIAELRADDVLGANVTVPHKEAVLPLLDRLDERAGRIGAVNVIANEGGQLAGYNTDVSGFARALREDAGFDAKGKHAALLGAGGATRAVALALIEAGASTILIAGRTPARAGEVCADLRPLARAGTLITWTYWGDGTFLRVLPEADLIVNCTPIGMQATDSEGESPVAGELIAERAVVFDLVYNPAETPLLKLAKERGAKPVAGLGMLVYQAADAFHVWTGKDAPVERMLEAAQGALES